MKRREYNRDDRKRQGQHKRQANIWTDTDKTNKSVCISPDIFIYWKVIETVFKFLQNHYLYIIIILLNT